MTAVNIPLMRKTLEWAEAEAAKPAIDRRWRQDMWITPADELADNLLDELPESVCFSIGDAGLTALAAHCGTAYCIAGYVGQLVDPKYVDNDGADNIPVSFVARDALGLTNDEAEELFAANNTIADVRRIAESIAGERL